MPSFKIFMNNRGGEGKRLGLPDIDDGFLFRLCEAAAAVGGMVCPHPETIELAWVLRERVMRADPDGKTGLAAWNDTRPPFVEADAVQRAALDRRRRRRPALRRPHLLGRRPRRRAAPAPRGDARAMSKPARITSPMT